MLTFSELSRFRILDQQGRTARLADLAIETVSPDHPPVTRLVYHGPDGDRSLPWHGSRLDRHRHLILVPDLTRAVPLSPSAEDELVWLGRDVLDALVLDIKSFRAMRVADIALDEQEGRLLICGVESSPRAILRRLSGGRLWSAPGGDACDWQHIEFLRGDVLAAVAAGDRHLRIENLPPGEIARLADALPYLHATELVTLLPEPIAADTMEAMSVARQVQVLEELSRDRALALLDLMRPDVTADLLGYLPPGSAQDLLEELSEGQRQHVLALLRYPDDTVGGIMTNDLVVLPIDLTVGEAKAALRPRLHHPDYIYFVYIVDDEQRNTLLGVVTLRALLVADDFQPLSEILRTFVITLDPLDPAAEAARRVLESELTALPVVAPGGKLLGAVTVDAALALIAPHAWGGQSPRLFS